MVMRCCVGSVCGGAGRSRVLGRMSAVVVWNIIAVVSVALDFGVAPLGVGEAYLRMRRLDLRSRRGGLVWNIGVVDMRGMSACRMSCGMRWGGVAMERFRKGVGCARTKQGRWWMVAMVAEGVGVPLVQEPWFDVLEEG